MRAASSKRAMSLVHRIKRAEAERDRLTGQGDELRLQRAEMLVDSLRNELANIPLDVEKSAKRETREDLLRELLAEVRSLHAGSNSGAQAASFKSGN